MNKKKLFVSAALAVCVCLFLSSAYFVLYRPFSIEKTYIRIFPFVDAKQFEETKDYINRNSHNGAYQIFCETDNFPSESYEDYCEVSISFAIKNHSPFKTSVGDGYIKNMKSADFILFKHPIFMDTLLNPLETKLSESSYTFLCYKGNLSDEEIIEKFKGLQVNMLYETPFFMSLNYNKDLSKLFFISSFMEYEKIRNEIEGDFLAKSEYEG